MNSDIDTARTFTNGTFQWSAPSATMALIVVVDSFTTYRSLRMYHSHRGMMLYAVMAVAATAHIFDFSLQLFYYSFVNDAADPGPNDDGAPPTPELASALYSQLWVGYGSLIAAFFANSGMQFVNGTRYWSFAARRAPIRAKILCAFSALSIASNLGNTVYYLWSYHMQYATGDTSYTVLGDKWFSSWSIYDGLVSCALSVEFMRLLLSVKAPQSRGAVSAELRTLIRETMLNLGLEICATIVSNTLILALGDFDPYWCSIYLSESFRMRLFSYFLDQVTRIMQHKPRFSSSAGGSGGAAGHSATINESVIQSVPGSALTTTTHGSGPGPGPGGTAAGESSEAIMSQHHLQRQVGKQVGRRDGPRAVRFSAKE